MQIFFLSRNPRKAAQFLCDKHVVKMPTETAQILATVLWIYNPMHAWYFHNMYGLYKPFYNRKHPTIMWVGASVANYMWAIDLLEELCKEYTFRYKKTHYCERFVHLHRNVFGIPHLLKTEWVPMTEEYQAIQDKTMKDSNPIIAYMTYYFLEKRSFAKWNKTRPAPGWWNCNIDEVEKIYA